MFGRMITEGLTEGALFIALGKAWEWASAKFSALGLGDEVKKRLFKGAMSAVHPDGKGFVDENLFARALAEAEVDAEKKKMIVDVMNQLESDDKRNGTSFAKNFRLIVVIADLDDLKNGATVRPGVTIIKEIATQCKSEEEVMARIVALGAMQDPFFTVEKFLKYGKEVILPALLEFGQEKIERGNEALASATSRLNAATEEKRARLEDRPWWMRLINP